MDTNFHIICQCNKIQYHWREVNGERRSNLKKKKTGSLMRSKVRKPKTPSPLLLLTLKKYFPVDRSTSPDYTKNLVHVSN